MTGQNLLNTEEKMRRAVDGLKQELATIRTGRAAPSLIEHIKVDYAGVPTPLNHLASISAPEANLLIIQPWDKGSSHSIEKAILTSDIGLNPVNSGNIIRITVPPLSEERRHELIKVVRKRVEERRISIRNLRREAMDELKEMEKNKDISQDEHKRTADQLQKLTDSYITETEHIGKDKETDLMQV